MRRVVRCKAVAALLPLLVLLCLALACTGGDTAEVQESVNQTKVGYEEWLRATGLLPDYMIGAPLIVEPADGETASGGDLIVKGWSMKASDRTSDPSIVAKVRVYLATSAQRLAPASVLTPFAEGTAVVNEGTGEWELTIPVSRLFKGTNYIAARTEIDGVGSSGLTWVSVFSTEGRAAEVPDSAAEHVDLVCVMATRDDHTFSGGASAARERFEDAIADVDMYLRATSHGQLAVGETEWVNAPGEVFDLDFDKSYYDAVGEYAGLLLEYDEVERALEAIEKRTPGRAVSVIVLVPEASETNSGASYLGFSLPWDGDGVRGSFIHLRTYSPRTIAHEIMHGMGRNRRVDEYPQADSSERSKADAQLPDLYHVPYVPWLSGGEEEYYGVSGFSNLHELNSASNYFLMGPTAFGVPDGFIPTLSGFSQHWLEWAEYEPQQVTGSRTSVTVPNLSMVVQRSTIALPIITSSDPGRPGYLVMEGRSRGGEHESSGGFAWWKGDGVVLYRIREWPDGVADSGAKRAAQWIRGIDYVDTLSTGNQVYYDPQYRFTIRLATNTFASSADSQQVEVAPITPVPRPPFDSVFRSTGAMLAPTGDFDQVLLAPAASRLARGAEGARVATAEPPAPYSGSAAPFPDLDLHAYLVDGRHIGMNYETGEFENPVPEAIISGDRSLDNEWILLPPDLTEGARYEISSYDTQATREYFPDLTEEQLTLAYEVTPMVLEEDAGSLAEGDPVSGSLAPGASESTTVDTVGDTIVAAPPAAQPPDDDGGSGAGSSHLPPLLGALALVVAGMLVLVWPRRRRKV